jgi:putative toxin-antitoxin system antitoxin component (TIGR02293 family)
MPTSKSTPVRNTRGASSKPQTNARNGSGEKKLKVKTIIKSEKNNIQWTKNENSETLDGKFENITDKLSTIVKAAIAGVKTDIFYQFAHAIDMPDKLLAELINTSPKTISNYKDQKKTLEPVKGEHLLKMIRLFKKGEEIFGNLTEFRYWLTKPQALSGTRMIEWLVTPGGIELISDELDRIAHGYAL